MWIRSQNFLNAHFKAQLPVCNTSLPAEPFVPKGFCHKFRKGNDYPGCNFEHQGFRCGVVHPALRCNFRNQQSNQLTRLPNHTLSTAVPINKLRLLLSGYDLALTFFLLDGFTFSFLQTTLFRCNKTRR